MKRGEGRGRGGGGRGGGGEGGGGEGGGGEGGGAEGGGGYINLGTQKMAQVLGHTKHPHVTEPSEPSEVDTFWSHPFYGQLSP